MKQIKHLLVLVALLLPLFAQAADKEVLAKLQALPGVSDVQELKSTAYDNKYLLNITQEVDPIHHQAGTFKQRVVVCHVGYDRPTVLVTEGYNCKYALREGYQEELSKLLNANLVFVEYRYFEASTPSPCNWDYLTVENSLYDLHNVNQTFRQLYKGKWVSTGISKGGQTCIFYRVFFPDDVDVSVPYVAPLNSAVEDGHHEPFIDHQVSTATNRKHVKDYQIEVLKRKAKLMPMFTQYCNEKGYSFRIPLEEIFDYCVLEYSFAIWQWGTPMTQIPDATASDKDLFNHLIGISEPGYFTPNNPNRSFNVQAARELGYYGYDIKPFKKWLTIKSAKGYLHRVMLPKELQNVKFDKTLYNKTINWLKNNDRKMIYIYGGIDPWGASGVAGLKFLNNKKYIKVYVLPDGSHSTRISTFPEPTRTEIINLLHQYLETN